MDGPSVALKVLDNIFIVAKPRPPNFVNPLLPHPFLRT